MKLLIIAAISISLVGMLVVFAEEQTETGPPKVDDPCP